MICTNFLHIRFYARLFVMGDIIYNLTRYQGKIDKPSSSSKVQIKINGNLTGTNSNTIMENHSSASKSTLNVYGKKSFNGVLSASVNNTPDNKNEFEKWMEYTIKKGDTIWDLAVNRYHVSVDDIIRDNNILDPRKIQPGNKIRIRVSLPQADNSPQVVNASWYGAEYHGKTMANGDFFNMYAPTIAHKTLPLGTRVELENKETGVKIQAVVTDRGPFIAGRDVDLSYSLARALSIDQKGTGKLIMRVIG
jgi:rare lipoprotein A